MVFDSSSPVVEHYDSYSGFHDDTAAKIFRIFSKIIFKTRGKNIRNRFSVIIVFL